MAHFLKNRKWTKVFLFKDIPTRNLLLSNSDLPFKKVLTDSYFKKPNFYF